MSAPVTEYVLKVHSRCDLACDHCYVYEHADQSWLGRPRAISAATVERAARRIAEHAAAHRLNQVLVVLHGGEPLLLGTSGLRLVLTGLHKWIAPATRLELRLQTNGVRLDEGLCDLFAEYDVKVGVSLDGDRTANDLHRRSRDGRSSHPQVLRGLALLRRSVYRHLFSGILCTVDLRNDPIRVYEALLAEEPPRIDLLLPHATWESPPPRPDGVPAPYADWLAEIHDRWTRDGRPMPIRMFDSLLSAACGGSTASEGIGLDAVNLLVIETDGQWEQADSLKTAFDGAPATGLNVRDHSVDEAAAHPGIGARRGGLSALCTTCRACPVVRICGGGLYAHRYRADTGFDNPSVFCEDLKALIPRVIRATFAGEPEADRPRERHELPPGSFDALAAGAGDPESVASLAEMRLSLTRALVAAAGTQVEESPARPSASSYRSAELRQAAVVGWDLLCRLDAERSEAVRKILTHPYTQAWALRCLRPPAGADRDLDLAHVAGIAAAAALHAGVEAELALAVRDEQLHLPTIGALLVAEETGRTVKVRVTPDGVAARHGRAVWRPVRRAGTITVDDLDPFRDCQVWPAAHRLDPGAWLRWRHALTAAVGRLSQLAPPYARVLQAGLRTIVPLQPDPAGRDRSGTARQAFGAVAVALPADVGTLMMLLVHEVQHLKLNALLDLYELFDRQDRTRLAVPWRPGERRPVEGVLHGVYAHLAIADLWCSRARAVPGDPDARRNFRRYRSWVHTGLNVLADSRALTAEGEHFLNGMRGTAEAWVDVP